LRIRALKRNKQSPTAALYIRNYRHVIHDHPG
jgi:hypothetical protein